MMLGMVMFERADTALTMGDLDWDYCKKVSDHQPVLTAGSQLFNIGMGMYLVDNPNVIEDTLFSLYVKGTPDKYSEGVFGQDIWSMIVPDGYEQGSAGYELGRMRETMNAFIIMLGRLLSQTYNTGQIASPYSPVPGAGIQIFVGSNYTGVTTVGEKWGTILSTAGVKVFFTTKAGPNATFPVIDAECIIEDAVAGAITIKLTKTQTAIKVGDYFWQLEARTYSAPNVIDEIWVMQEGKLYAKPTYKA